VGFTIEDRQLMKIVKTHQLITVLTEPKNMLIRSGVFRIWPLGFGKGGAWRARRARAYNGGLGGGAPSGVQGQSPWSRGQGSEAP